MVAALFVEKEAATTDCRMSIHGMSRVTPASMPALTAWSPIRRASDGEDSGMEARGNPISSNLEMAEGALLPPLNLCASGAEFLSINVIVWHGLRFFLAALLAMWLDFCRLIGRMDVLRRARKIRPFSSKRTWLYAFGVDLPELDWGLG